jgi:gluconokinase
VADGPQGASGVVLGVDIGTTATKVVAFDALGTAHASHSAGYPLEEPADGHAVQDPEAILAAVREGVRSVAAEVARRGGTIRGLTFSAAMHTLIGLDGDSRPLTPSITWADVRASAQADRLRAGPDWLGLHQRTGTPVHPMSPFVKLVWFREEEPELAAAVRHWVGIKEVVVHRLTGVWAVDHSVASATGLLDRHRLDWDERALELAGISRDQLAPLVPTTAVLGPVLPEVAADLGLADDVPVVTGASDGPCANLGLGAVRPGVAAISIGTSGALRVSVEDPRVDESGQVFCYALTEDRWVVGGAVNNGGVVLEWAGDALAPDLRGHPDELLELAASAPPGSDGLLVLPHLLGERAPRWETLARGAYVGLERSHRREHLLRALIEGSCLQLALVLRSVEDAGYEVREVRATGGFARSEWWRQLLADVLGRPVGYPRQYEGSAYGAALLGQYALGMVPDLEAAGDAVELEETLVPDPAAAAVYRDLLPLHHRLADALRPTLAALRALGA